MEISLVIIKLFRHHTASLFVCTSLTHARLPSAERSKLDNLPKNRHNRVSN